MCGIAGFYGQPVDERKSIINGMMETLHHRGPDGEGYAFLDHLTFGHKRLAIIDISQGQQPMYSEDGRFTLIFNGEIYNYIEIRQGLLARGYPLKTFSDSEVLLYAYIEYGVEVLQYLNGMFAFAIHDNQTKQLFIARDHFGIKPFYYYEGRNDFVFASEIKALLKHPSIEAEMDEDAFFEYLSLQLIMGSKTMFKNIKTLEPAHYMIVREGKVVEHKNYWSIDYSVDETKTEAQFADELLVLLENSLSLQIRSDVPVGSYLSGGLDSSTVAVLAAKSYFGQLKTFSGAFSEGAEFDETKYAKLVSNQINSDHYEIFPTAQDFLESIDLLVYHMDQPQAGPGLFPQYMVSKLAAEHVKVVLGGQGGDEIFGGYARYAVAYLEQCVKGAIFETQEEGKHVVTLSSIIPNLPILKQYTPMIQAQFSAGLFGAMDERYYHLIDRSPHLDKMYDVNLIQRRQEDRILSSFKSIFHFPATPSYFNKMTHFDIKVLLPALLQIEDRVSMAVSLESRVPLLDRRIMELSASMPPTMKFAGGKTKYMFLKSVQNILPKAIVERKDKMGFPVPINNWLAGPLSTYISDIFSSQASKDRGIFKNDAVIDQVQKVGKFNRTIWGALNLELWCQKFLDS